MDRVNVSFILLKKFLLYMVVQLTMLASGVRQSDSAMHMHVSFFKFFFPIKLL